MPVVPEVIVSQLVLLAAVQAQADAEAVMFTVAVPPLSGSVAEVGETVKVHPDPWLIVTV